jgi:Glycosyl transferase family 90
MGRYSIPLFTTAASVSCNHTFPFPNYQTIRDSKEQPSEWDTAMGDYRATYPWSTKTKQIVWRGSLTGTIINATHKSPRWQMLQGIAELDRRNASDDHQLFDFGATRLPGRHGPYRADLHQVGGLVNGISPMADFQRYRGILDVDGNSWSSRFGALLCYNSVVVKVEPSYVDYFYSKASSSSLPPLVPWTHYIPVQANNLTDLIDKARFVMDDANDDTVQTIVLHANAWCRQNMIAQTIAHDVLDILERYVELLDQGSPGWDGGSQWTEAKDEIFSPNSTLDMIHLPSLLMSPD